MQVRRILFDKSGKIATGVEVTRDWGRTVFHVSILEFAQNILKMIKSELRKFPTYYNFHFLFVFQGTIHLNKVCHCFTEQ